MKKILLLFSRPGKGKVVSAGANMFELVRKWILLVRSNCSGGTLFHHMDSTTCPICSCPMQNSLSEKQDRPGARGALKYIFFGGM